MPDQIVATIVEGEVPLGEPSAIKDSSGNDYADAMSFNRYDSDPHVYLMPITSPSGFQGQTAAFVQLAAETLIFVHDWTVARMGERPNVPNPNLSDSNWVLLRKMPETAMITVGPDGLTPLYRISGVYVYGKKNATGNTYENVYFPKSQIIDDVFPRTIITPQLEGGLAIPDGSNSTTFPGQTNIPPIGFVTR